MTGRIAPHPQFFNRLQPISVSFKQFQHYGVFAPPGNVSALCRHFYIREDHPLVLFFLDVPNYSRDNAHFFASSLIPQPRTNVRQWAYRIRYSNCREHINTMQTALC